ncbi:MAG: hypothetical protein AB7E98_01175 [Pirellulales bacterium]
MSEPLPGAALVFVALILAAGAVAFRRATNSPAARTGTGRYVQCAVPTVVLALWAIGLLVPGTPSLAGVAFVGLLAVEEGWSWGRLRFAPLAVAPAAPARATSTPPVRGGLLDEFVEGPETSSPPSDAEALETASQWIVRRRDEFGAEVMEGWVRVEFAPGQRHAAAHLAICPPFAALPECYAEPAAGPDAQVKVGQVLSHGVRLDVKLDQPAEEASTLTVEFSIQERPVEEKS